MQSKAGSTVIRTEQYQYKNCPIPGGGYVTGFIFHPYEKDVFYIRTDIGGTYKFHRDEMRWESLIKHVTMEDLSETYPIALALDDNRPDKLYIMSGVNANPHGILSVSEDGGVTFARYQVPMHVHGNLNGRGTGFRLIVDKKDDQTLWFASQDSGLWKSADGGKTWQNIPAMKEQYLTLVGQTKDGSALFVGGAGVTTVQGEHMRGHSLYVSYDQGETFEKLWQPEDREEEGVKLAGRIAQRYVLDDEYLYVTYSVMGRNAYVYELGYSCDGGSVIGGKVVRYPLQSDGKIGFGEDITPDEGITTGESTTTGEGITLGEKVISGGRTNAFLEYGFSGISVVPKHPGWLVVSTISKEDGDCIYRSKDFGETWECILYDLEIGTMAFRTEYMKPKYNGNHNLIHWLTDIKVNPFDPNELWFNTGTGVFRSKNLTEEQVVFEDWSDGIEETVHLNVYGLPAGEVQVLDIVGDLGGFAFHDLNTPCDNSFADENGNRYITCINADYSEEDPSCFVVTPRGNWTGLTKGGLIITKDQGKTFRRLPMPYGISEELDEALHILETPNVNSGWVAMSPDCKNIVWSIAGFIELPVDRVLVSRDGGETFEKISVFDRQGQRKTTGGFKCFSDRVNSSLFYGFGDHFDFYVSEDGGKTFYEILPRLYAQKGKNVAFESEVLSAVTENKGSLMEMEQQSTKKSGEAEKKHPWQTWETLSDVDFSIIDTANKTEVRGNAGQEGSFYLALCEMGLWKMQYCKEEKTLDLVRLSKEGDTFYRMGLGPVSPEANYFDAQKAIYVAAVIEGEYGFYRTNDDGQTFVRINDANQMFGQPNSIDGDSRVYGRFYVATGSLGLVYGEPVG